MQSSRLHGNLWKTDECASREETNLTTPREVLRHNEHSHPPLIIFRPIETLAFNALIHPNPPPAL
jgi:hypothetical protein